MRPAFVICGVEHSGTTLLSDIFRQTESMNSGFETGVLLSKTPREFRELQPYAPNLLRGWKITESELDHICDTESIEEFYERLYVASRLINSPCKIFDKTPRYLACLEDCLGKFNGPYLIMYKDPRAIVYSDFTRTQMQERFDEWYESYKTAKLRYLNTAYNNYLFSKDVSFGNVLSVSLEEICLNTRQTLDEVFSHVSMAFELRYLIFGKLRYRHTRGKSISANIPFEYTKGLSAEQQARVAQDFEKFADWFYH